MDNSLKLTALPIEMLVRILKQAGSRLITEESIAEDIAAGAPQNEDSTINLIEYAAWLVKGDDTDAPDSN